MCTHGGPPAENGAGAAGPGRREPAGWLGRERAPSGRGGVLTCACGEVRRVPDARRDRITVNGCRPSGTSPSSAAASPAPRSPTSWRRAGPWCCWRPRPRSARTRRRVGGHLDPGPRGRRRPRADHGLGSAVRGAGRRAGRTAAARAPAGALDGDRRRRPRRRWPHSSPSVRASRTRPSPSTPTRRAGAAPPCARSAPRRSPRPPPTSTSPPCTPPTCAGCGLVAAPSARRARVVALRRDGAGWRMGSRTATRCTPARSSTRRGRGRTRGRPRRRAAARAHAAAPDDRGGPGARSRAAAAARRRPAAHGRATPTDRWYFKADGPHLLVSPADETPAEPGDARPDELDVALALERVEAVTGLGLRSVVTSWAGLRTFVPDRGPGRRGPAGAPGLLVRRRAGRIGHRDRARRCPHWPPP